METSTNSGDVRQGLRGLEDASLEKAFLDGKRRRFSGTFSGKCSGNFGAKTKETQFHLATPLLIAVPDCFCL